jgi:hypothetical protein
MSEAHRITDPNLLQDLYITAHPQQAKLVLLQPLTKTDMLKACRNHKSNGSNYEFLNIQPLSKIWRKELINIPPIPKLIFDLSLPKALAEEDEKINKVCWETTTEEDKNSLGVSSRDVMTLVVTIATETRMRMRSNNADVSFEVVYDDAKGGSPRGMALLKKQLLALSE